ncbi:hypothetical protein AZI86_18000 [Bdellovibrio bacteriovorus]|uniref:Uncharacterized protein n=1 Tax=Bdellovibrio bacteriovorus TaxID=959 RepID=A0A150WER5_BDEBC|nr:hypothetical protein [Bdellovibrio bacteriovorus]KYG61597.1 hypothetical protein AZI86_18000 [Bdellovibrio bacteriovorus]
MKECLFFLLLTAALPTMADGAQVVVCFKDAAKTSFFNGGDLSAEGEKNLKSIQPFIAWTSQNKIFGTFEEDTFYDEVWARFQWATPHLFQPVWCYYRQDLKKITEPATTDELPLLDDNQLPIALPKNCVLRQVILHTSTTQAYIPSLIKRIRMSQEKTMSLLRLQQDFTQFSKDVYGHLDAGRARIFLTSLVDGIDSGTMKNLLLERDGIAPLTTYEVEIASKLYGPATNLICEKKKHQ